jgi:hypothetical protein
MPHPLLCLYENKIPLDSDTRWLSIVSPQRVAYFIMYQGVLISVGGLGMLVSSDLLTGKNGGNGSKGEGDGFMILGATLYGICSYLRSICHIFSNLGFGLANATEEFFVRKSPLY